MCGGWSTSGPDTPTRTSRNAGSSPGTSMPSTGPGTTSGCSGTAAVVFTCEDSPGRRSFGTGWCQERRRSTTPPWPNSGRGGAAAGTPCWTRSPCVCSRRKTAAVHGAGVSCCTPTTNRKTPTSGNSGSRWSATRSANTRSSPRPAAPRRTNPPPYAWYTPTAADTKALTPAAVQHVCPSASPRGLLEPDAVGAARPVLRGRGRSNASPLPGGLGLDDPGFDPSVLSEFRARLAEGGRADALLDGMLERLKAAGLVRAGGRVRTDSTHVLACVRRPGPDRDPRRGPARRLGGDRPDQSRLDRAAAAAGLGRALRPQGGDRPAAWPQARLRRQADRADRCRRPAPARRGRCRPGRGLDQRPATGEDPARPVGSALPAHARRASALQGRRRAAPGRPAHPLALRRGRPLQHQGQAEADD